MSKSELGYYLKIRVGNQDDTIPIEQKRSLWGSHPDEWQEVHRFLDEAIGQDIAAAVVTEDGVCMLRVQDGISFKEKNLVYPIRDELGMTSSSKEPTNRIYFGIEKSIKDGDDVYKQELVLKGETVDGRQVEIYLWHEP